MAHDTRQAELESRKVAESGRQTEWRLPSFGKELFLGRLRLDLISPFPEEPAEVRAEGDAFVERVRTLCETEWREVGFEIERTSIIPDHVLKGLADLGAFGMKIPKEYGGLGLSQLTYNRVLMLFAQVHTSLGALLSAHQSIGVPQPVKSYGTEEQKKKYLPRCAAGAVTAFLLTEPGFGSDAARMKSTAVPTEDGSGYLLNGLKLWTTNGVIADLVVVMARVPASEGHKGGISAFVVEMDSSGITVENRNAFMGLRGLENGVTRFCDVLVPKDTLLGKEGDGLRISLSTLNAGRLAIPAMCAAGAKWSTKIAREWAAERPSFGRPIATHGAVAEKLAFMASTAFALDALQEITAIMVDQGRNDIRIESAIAKLYATEMGYRVADELVQVRGGRGYETADSLRARGERAVPAEQQLRDMRINRIFEGSTEIMRLLLAREATDAHLQAAGDIIDPDVELKDKAKAGLRAAGFYAKWLPQLAVGRGVAPTSYSRFDSLATHLRYVERSARKLARSTFYGMSRWQARLEYEQAFLGRIVDIGAELFVMSAVIVKADQIRRQHGGTQGSEAYELAGHFCRQARLRVDALFHALWDNTDAADRKLAKALTDGRYAWLSDGIVDLTEGTGPWTADESQHPSRVETVHRPVLKE
ncbi:MAG: acyl-CoA dehydrogenase family protein [Kineosporiaceae bacterium]